MKNSPFKRHDDHRISGPHEVNETGPVLNFHDSDDDWEFIPEKVVFDPDAELKAKRAARDEANKPKPLVNWMPGRSKELAELSIKRK